MREKEIRNVVEILISRRIPSRAKRRRERNGRKEEPECVIPVVRIQPYRSDTYRYLLYKNFPSKNVE